MLQAAAQMRGARAGNSAPQPGLFGEAQRAAQQQAMGGAAGAPATGTPGNFAGLESMLQGLGQGGQGGQNPMAGMQGLFGPGSPFGAMGANAGGNPFGGFAPPQPQDGRSPEERYEVCMTTICLSSSANTIIVIKQIQLQTLRDMGFTNASREFSACIVLTHFEKMIENVRALIATGGDVQGAINYILEGGGV